MPSLVFIPLSNLTMPWYCLSGCFTRMRDPEPFRRCSRKISCPSPPFVQSIRKLNSSGMPRAPIDLCSKLNAPNRGTNTAFFGFSISMWILEHIMPWVGTDDSFAGMMLRPSPAATAGETGVLRFPSMRACILPATPTLKKQCGAAFGWISGSTFISRRTLGSVRLLLSTPLVQLRAAQKPPCSLPRPLRASGVDSASLRPIRQS